MEKTDSALLDHLEVNAEKVVEKFAFAASLISYAKKIGNGVRELWVDGL